MKQHRATFARKMVRAGFVPVRGWFKPAKAKALEEQTAKNVAEVMADDKGQTND